MSTVQPMRQISSLAQADKQVAAATAPRRFKNVHLPLMITIAVLVLYGLIVVYSAVAGNESYNFFRQVGGVAIGIVLMLLIFRFDYHQLSHYLVFFLIVNTVLIMSPHIPFIGQSVNGATSWISLGPVRLQPGEFAKVTVILQAAAVVARYNGRLDDPMEFLKALGLMFVPVICIMTQPDLGTGMVYMFIGAVALIVGGARPKYLLIVLGVIVGGVVALFLIDPIADAIAGSDVLLKDYQRARLLVFLDNSYDTSGNGYNLQQAKIAIGSGGLFGKGWMNATQSTLGYLPESPTDFIFCVLAEQFGFVGALFLLVLYGLLVYFSFRIAYDANDLFGTVIVMCIAGMWLFQIMQNIGMDIGLMPITGIPLPFMSYGSSFMIVNFILIGFIGSVWAHNGR